MILIFIILLNFDYMIKIWLALLSITICRNGSFEILCYFFRNLFWR